MKKKHLLIIMTSIFIAGDVLADWGTNRYFQCAITKKFTARAKLKPPTNNTFSFTYDSGCSYAQTDISSQAVPPYNVYNCGYAFARCDGANANQRTGWAQCGWNWGENVTFEIPKYSFAPMYSYGQRAFENEENYTGASLNDEGINFDETNRNITIKNLNGILNIESQDLKNNFCTFQIKVYTFKMDGENQIPVTILWKAKATLINGDLILEDNFQSSEFTKIIRGDRRIFSIKNVTKIINIDDNINIEDVTVEISGDGGNLGIGISDTYAPNLETEQGKILIGEIEKQTVFNFNISHNQEKVTALITKNSQRKTINEISIMTIDGKLIKEHIITSESEILDFNTNDMTNGVYLFVIRSGDEYFSKKFFK